MLVVTEWMMRAVVRPEGVRGPESAPVRAAAVPWAPARGTPNYSVVGIAARHVSAGDDSGGALLGPEAV